MEILVLIVSFLAMVQLVIGSAGIRNVPNGVCKYMAFTSINARLNTTCASVVNYEYFLPNSYTDEHLNSVAFTMLGDSRMGSLPVSCQESLKANACASVYLKCHPEGTLDETTYAPSFPLPFQRPCLSLCSPVASKCLGVLKLFSLAPNCTATADYTFGNSSFGQRPKYDPTNSDTHCNTLSTSIVKVASMREDYIFSETGACAGIVTDPIFVPPGHLVSNLIAPMQPPYQVQTIIENQLRSVFMSLPSTTPPVCKFALRKAHCGSSFLKSSMSLFGSAAALTTQVKTAMKGLGISTTALMNYNLSLPSYPHSTVCTTFKTACAGLLRVAPALALNCTGKSPTTGAALFPSANQTVSTVSLKVGVSTLKLTYSSPPNTMSRSVDKNIPLKSSSYKCMTPPEAFGMHPENFVCSRVVDYPFLLPVGTNISILHNQAMLKLNTSATSVLPTQCLQSLMRMVCSMIYRKCPKEFDPRNTETWNYQIYSDKSIPVPMPFQRPCRNVCDDVNQNCFGLLTLLAGETFRCGEDTYDYSNGLVNSNEHPLQYDQSNDGDVCNNISTAVAVAPAVEKYRFQSRSIQPSHSSMTSSLKATETETETEMGFCDGIITDLWVPPSSSFGIAPLQGPFVIQTAIEEKLQAINSQLRVYFTPECRLALKKIVCGSVYLAPQAIHMKDLLHQNGINIAAFEAQLIANDINATALLNYIFYIPSFPSRAVCQSFQQQCPLVVAAARNTSTMLDVSCTDADINPSMGALLFPAMQQLIGLLPLHWNNQTNTFTNSSNVIELSLMSQPNDMSSAELAEEYEPRCPMGYVVPEVTEDHGIRMVSGTACAVSCARPLVFRQAMWDHLYSPHIADPIIASLILIVFGLIFLFSKGYAKRYWMLLLFAISSFINDIVGLIVAGKNLQEEGSAFCSSNAVPFDPDNDPNNDLNHAGMTCSAQAVILQYTLLFNCLCWVFLAIDLYLRYARQFQSTAKLVHGVYLPIIFLLPLISVFIQTGSHQFGYQVPFTYCLNKYALGENKEYLPEREYFYKPLVFYTSVGYCFIALTLGTALYRTIRSGCSFASAAPTESSLLQEIRSVCFLIAIGVLWLVMIAIKFSSYANHSAKVDRATNELVEITQCVFNLYNGTDASWLPTCGDEIPHAENIRQQMLRVRFCMFCQGVIFGVAYFPIWNYWSNEKASTIGVVNAYKVAVDADVEHGVKEGQSVVAPAAVVEAIPANDSKGLEMSVAAANDKE